MPDLIIYPYGKPVKVRWDNEAVPPTPEEVDGIIAHYKSVYPQGGSRQVATGRLPERTIGGQLPVQGQIGGLAPVQPFGPGTGVQDQTTKQPFQKQAITNPNIVRDRPAPKIGFTAADYPASKVPVTKKPTVPQQPQVPITNPALQEFGKKLFQPNVAKQIQANTDIRTPQGKENAKKAIQAERRKPMAQGSFAVPGLGRVDWIQQGPGYVADVPGLGIVKAADPKSLSRKIHAGFVDMKAKADTESQAPGRTAYIPSDQTGRPTNVQGFGDMNTVTLPNGQVKPKQNLNDKERLLLWNQRIGEMTQSVASGVKHVSPYGLANDVADIFGIKTSDSAEAINGFIADQIAGAALMPIDAIGDMFVLASPEFDLNDRSGALGNIFLKLTGAGIGNQAAHEFLGVVGRLTKKFGNKVVPNLMDLMGASPERAAKAYAKLSLNPQDKAAVESFLKENPNFTPKDLEGYTSPNNLKEAGVTLKTGENPAVAAKKAELDARLKSTTTKGTKRSGHADFTKDDFNDALELAELYVKKVGYTFEQYAKEMVDYFGDGVKPHLKEIWDTHAPKTEIPKVPKVEANNPPIASKPEAKPGGDVTGVAKQVTGRDPLKGVTREEMDQIGKDALLKDSNIVANAVEKTKNEGKVMDETELSAAAVRLRQISNKESEIRGQIDGAKDPAELFRFNAETHKLEAERESILMATDYSLNRGFHRMGIAAQLVHKPDFSLGMLKAKAKAAFLNTVEVIPKHVETKLASYASSIDRLNAELDAAKKQIHDLVNKGTFRRGTKENNVKRLRKFFGETSGEYTPMASKNTRQRGAVYTIPSEERDAMMAMRSLAKQLADDGAKNLDDIVAGIRKEVGQNIPEETIYRMLSDKYRKYLLESDVHRMDANRYLRDIQRGAEFKLREPLEKSLAVASDILGSTARSMQAGWDVSAPFIQGRKGLVANPTGWFKAWENQLKAYRHGDEVVTRRLAEMERHPMYSRFVAAGGDKLLRRPGGHFSAQEETFANNFMRLASETMDKGGPVGKYNPANLYLKGLERSDAAFSAFMNDLTWDTFLKFSRAAPNDPAFLRDSVHNLGVIYGRGTGPIAEAIGRSKLGDVFYAPRYTLSQMQYAGTPIRALNPKAFETTAGRMQALKIYGTQAAAYGTLVALARLAGWDIETDLRSSDFGTIALPGGRRLDIFGKESQAYRLVANIVAGRVSKKNEYEPPSITTAAKSVGQFGMGKLAPGPRLPSDVLFGSFDPDKGATPFTMAEFGKRYLPLWVQQTLQNEDLATVPLAILGQDVSKDQKTKLTPEQRAKSHPMELPKIKAKPDPLGRPQDPKAQVNDGDVIREVQRLGIELKWPDTVEGESEEAFKMRAKKQGDAVRDAIRSQMSASLYKDATVTEKRELLKSEISRAKRDFNKDFNESEKTRKADERLKQIERELASGRK